MPLTNAGRDFIAQAIVDLGVKFVEANTYLGVGDSTALFDPAQTDLQGQSARQIMDAGYPVVDGNTITFKATFDGDKGNFTWNEWGVFNADTDGVMLNRNVEYNGIKLQGQTWIFEVVITIELEQGEG